MFGRRARAEQASFHSPNHEYNLKHSIKLLRINTGVKAEYRGQPLRIFTKNKKQNDHKGNDQTFLALSRHPRRAH